RRAEATVGAAVGLPSQLVRKGGSVAMLTVLVTQKPTADALPTVLRDNCGLALAFGLKTVEASVSALGEEIRQHRAYCPTTLQGDDYIGVCSASLRTGLAPFTRIRVPLLDDSGIADRAASTAQLRRDPSPRGAAAGHKPQVPALAETP